MDSKGKGGAWLAVMVVAIVVALGMGETSGVVASASGPKDEYSVRAAVMVSAGLDLARRENLEDVAPLPPVQSGPTNVEPEPTSEPTSVEVRDIDLASESKAVAWASVIKPQEAPVEQVVAAPALPDDGGSVPPPDDEPVAPVAPAAPVMRRVIVGYDRTCVNGQCYSVPRYAMVEDTSAVAGDEELLLSDAYADDVYSEGGVVAGAFSRLRENKPVRTFIKNRLSNMRSRRCSRLGCG